MTTNNNIIFCSDISNTVVSLRSVSSSRLKSNHLRSGCQSIRPWSRSHMWLLFGCSRSDGQLPLPRPQPQHLLCLLASAHMCPSLWPHAVAPLSEPRRAPLGKQLGLLPMGADWPTRATQEKGRRRKVVNAGRSWKCRVLWGGCVEVNRRW